MLGVFRVSEGRGRNGALGDMDGQTTGKRRWQIANPGNNALLCCSTPSPILLLSPPSSSPSTLPPPLHTAPSLQRRNSVQPWLFWNSRDQAGLRLRDPLHVTVASQRMPICCDYFLTKHYPGNCTEQETWSACLLLGINFSFECLF